ncbi:MAG: ribonuclease H-like YkuK family protein [Acidiferrobacterales bacterium]
MIDGKWKVIDGPAVDLRKEFAETVKLGDREVHIGTDSQQKGGTTNFVTVVVILQPGKGGRAFYLADKMPRIKSLRERLMKEVWMSVTLGMELNEFMPAKSPMTIHIDANPNVKFRSSDYVKELVGMVVGQGFKSLVKPESWCATHAADHVVKM